MRGVTAGTPWAMFAIAAAILFTVAALVAFHALSGISATGLIATGLACLAVHLIWPAIPWRDPARRTAP